MASRYHARVRSMAQTLGRCPAHPRERLKCGACDWEWGGTDAEADELIRLIEPIAPYMDQILPQGRCRCGDALHCSVCWEAEASRIHVTDGVAADFGEAECRRYHELMTLFRRKEPYALPYASRPS